MIQERVFDHDPPHGRVGHAGKQHSRFQIERRGKNHVDQVLPFRWVCGKQCAIGDDMRALNNGVPLSIEHGRHGIVVAFVVFKAGHVRDGADLAVVQHARVVHTPPL